MQLTSGLVFEYASTSDQKLLKLDKLLRKL